MKTLLTALLLLPAFALAHPGHGKPGFIHDHALEDLALVLLGVAVVGMVGWALFYLLTKKKT
ncbi:MAG: hypothetical protein ACT4P4_09540 [Betaproteobacteria bacterium]